MHDGGDGGGGGGADELQERPGLFSAIYSWLSAVFTAAPGLFLAKSLQDCWPYAWSPVLAVT